MIVIADTSPLNYLVLVGAIDVLPILYKRIIIPQAVFDELHADATPQPVKEWIDDFPFWIKVEQAVLHEAAALLTLDKGEREAIALAQQLKADALIIDDRDGRQAASQRGIKVIGTLGVLNDAAMQGLIDLPTIISKLQHTSFRASSALIASLLADDEKRKRRTRLEELSSKVPDVEPDERDRIE